MIALTASAMICGVQGQQIVDKTVATVGDGVRTELITYSDLLWQLALQPGSSVTEPTSAELNQALQAAINQRLFALEAERLPRPVTDEEISGEINRLLTYFPTTAEFEKRLNRVGFQSIKDDNFERIISQRVAIDKYLDFRFRSFVVITADDEAKYYREVFVPDFRERYKGLLMPTLDEKRPEIRQILEEERVSRGIEAFLEEAKRRVQVDIISAV